MSEAKAGAKAFTAGETSILTACFRHMTGDAGSMINFDAVAAELGYKDGPVARARFRQIRTKMLANGGATSEGPVGGVDKSTPTKKSPGRPRKATADKEDNGASPDKPKRGRKPKSSPGSKGTKQETEEDGAVVKPEENEDDVVNDVDEEVDGVATEPADGEPNDD